MHGPAVQRSKVLFLTSSCLEQGFLTIQDRSKDLIKSGGEWISSIDLENVVMGHPDVANCAVIAVKHPKWDERPLLIVVPREEKRVNKAEIDELLLKHFAKWQLPDSIEFIDKLPLTATSLFRPQSPMRPTVRGNL